MLVSNIYSWNAALVSEIALVNIEMYLFLVPFQRFSALFNIYSSSHDLLVFSDSVCNTMAKGRTV